MFYLSVASSPLQFFFHFGFILGWDGHWQEKYITDSSSKAEVVKWEQHSFRVSSPNAVNTIAVVDRMSRPRPNNWLVRLLFIKGQGSFVVEQDFSLTQVWLVYRKNFRLISKLTEASSTRYSIEKDSGRSALTLASSSVLQFPGILLCLRTYTSETLVMRPKRRSRQQRHSLKIFE